jgi:hypothetical protein
MFKAAFCASWTNQKNDGVHVRRNGILRQGLLGAENGSLNTLVNDGHDVAMTGMIRKSPGPALGLA